MHAYRPSSNCQFPCSITLRFDINDRKGLEIVILTSLLTFSDANESYHAAPALPASSTRAAPASDNAKPSLSEAPPKPPPKPAPKTGIDRIAELQAIRGEYNEVTIEDEGSVQDYAHYCSNLLNVCSGVFPAPQI